MSETDSRANVRGIVAMTAGNLLFMINDTALKLASGNMGLSQLLFMRVLFAIPLLVAIALAMGALRNVRIVMNVPVFFRSIMEVGAAYFFMMALLHVPIADANAIMQIVPLAITAAGAIFLGEKVGWRRWTAIVVGLIGVIIVIRPGMSGFHPYSLFALGAVLCVTARDMVVRYIPAAAPGMMISLVVSINVAIATVFISLLTGEKWVVPNSVELAYTAVAGIFLGLGFLLSIMAMRNGDISVVAPFRYTMILFAIIGGMIVWGEIPDRWMILGTAIIAATGVYTFYREQKLARLRGRG